MRHRRSAFVFALGASALVAARVVVGCSSFEDEPAPAPDAAVSDAPPADGPSSDGPLADGAVPDGPVVPYCSARDAALCFEFPRPPVNTGWDSVEYASDASVLSWTEAGATEPGSAHLTFAPFLGATNTQAVQVRRSLSGATGRFRRLRFEVAVRLESVPAFGKNAIVSLYLGSVLFYIYQSHLGWSLSHLEYPPTCAGGANPCGGGTKDGTKAPAAPGTWERLSIVVEEQDAGPYLVTFEATNGERHRLTLPITYEPTVRDVGYLRVGFTDTSPADAARVLDIDDLSLTVE